jgi:hypothetical protein
VEPRRRELSHPEIRCQGHAAEALPLSSRGLTIRGPRRAGEVTLPELCVELTRSPEVAAARRAVSEETWRREEAMMADG